MKEWHKVTFTILTPADLWLPHSQFFTKPPHAPYILQDFCVPILNLNPSNQFQQDQAPFYAIKVLWKLQNINVVKNGA